MKFAPGESFYYRVALFPLGEPLVDVGQGYDQAPRHSTVDFS